jgi:hypothetical protein
LDVVEVDKEEDADPAQVPNSDWQPVPQYAFVEPHQPFFEQQLPHALPAQV